jgi:hypothetical protein
LKKEINFAIFLIFFYKSTDKQRYCDFKGSLCAKEEETEEKALLQNYKTKECLPSCTEMEIFLVGSAIFYILLT